jgi:uncharacterized membrane protein YqhA
MSHDTNHDAPMATESDRGKSVSAANRHIPKTRYIFLLAILSTYIAAIVLVLAGALETLHIIIEILPPGAALPLAEAKVHFLEVIDQFLMATILYVIAAGFYQLFVNAGVQVEPWLRVKTVGDLEQKLIGVLIVVLGVTALARVVIWDGQSDILPYGAGVAALIFALAFFATQSKH